MRIIKFRKKYRDDLIFMVLEAKNALGRIPGLNEDLLDIESSYFEKGDMFWIAIDESDRVIGSVGYNTDTDRESVTLHRLFVKYHLKRNGIGTALLNTAEKHIKSRGIRCIYVNLGKGDEWFESRAFYAKNGYISIGKNRMKKELSL